MLKKSASFVLASLRSSTYRSRTPRFFPRCGLAGRTFWASCLAFSRCSRREDQWSTGLRRIGARGSEVFGTSNPELRIAPFSHVTRFSRTSLWHWQTVLVLLLGGHSLYQRVCIV